MRPMFSVEKVGIDAGGNALAVVARLPACPPTLMPTTNAIAAVRRTAVIVRLVIVASGPPEGGPHRGEFAPHSLYRRDCRFAGEHRGDVSGGKIGHRRAGFDRAAAEMR